MASDGPYSQATGGFPEPARNTVSGGAPSFSNRGRGPVGLAVAVTMIGLLVTASLSWVSWRLDRRNEKRLLQVQTQQAAAVIASTVLNLSDPLVTTLRVAQATAGDPVKFRAATAGLVGPTRAFSTASLWNLSRPGPAVKATVGSTPALPLGSPKTGAFVTLAAHSATFVVTSIPGPTGQVGHVGYAVADPQDPRFVVYAERAIPANRQVEVERGSAFAELHFATYLGAEATPASLATTDLPPSALPMTGVTVRDSIPFGNSSITLVTSAKAPLGGALGRDLPWIVLLAGGAIAVASSAAAYRLALRRQVAESDARLIAGLYRDLDTLYGQQRTIAQSLQQALLPTRNPSIRNVEIACRYVAGAEGVDVGGDWYSIIALDEHRFGFVVGDVSGRGVSAATIMARLRFTMRAYLLEGHPPDVVLAMCSHQLDLAEDGHFATALVGVADIDSRMITLANAGHFPPLILGGGPAHYADTMVGLALGVEPESYETTTVAMPEGSILIAFTDGLVERRGEHLDAGLARLAAAGVPAEPDLDAMLTRIVTDLTDDEAEDDVAILAFRWELPAAGTP